MGYQSDLEIAQRCTMQPICDIARTVGIDDADIEPYGRHKAKVALSVLGQPPRGKGKLILVTAITPTPAGEGKTTTTIGLADALRRIGKDAAVALREPSLGPVFGRKGGATGGGYAQIVPMEDIDLHFTGDFHAIGAANNLLAAMLDNHIQQGNALGIDPRRITWRRCVDMNDRQLRCIVGGLGGRANGVPHEDGFDITAASEIMAVLCLAESMADLKARLGRIIVGYTYDGRPVTARDLKAVGAMAALLRDALKPNLVQTLEGTPAFVHGGPFANIAHGCNSVLATRMAMHRCDYAVTEAGFGADLGALRRGVPNLLHHVRCIRDTFGLPCVVAINRFPTDTDREIALLTELCGELGVRVVLSTVWADGGRGGEALAREVVRLCETENRFRFAYELDAPVEEKITAVVRRVYGGAGAEILPAARRQIRELEALGFGGLPVCIAKTQASLSDDPTLLGAPAGFTVTVRSVTVSAGAGFLVALTGDVLTMPGLPKVPAAENIDVDDDGRITGLF